MLSQAQIKYIRALQHKKYRLLHGSFVVEGDKIVLELLSSGFIVEALFAVSEWHEANRRAIPPHVKPVIVTSKELARISGLTSPNQVLAVAKIPRHDISHLPSAEDFSIYLDGIQDPGNLGTIIRTADWFGIKTIFCASGTADLYNPKVIQATMGSFARVRLIPSDLSLLYHEIEVKPVIYGASVQGDNLFHLKPERPALMVIGNESKGISHTLRPFIDRWVSIPGEGRGAESLNASVAAAIMMAWFTKC